MYSPSSMANKTVTVTIPHRLGAVEARRRLQQGITQLRTQYAGQVASIEERWEADHMEFQAGLLGQTLTGRLDVQAESVRVELDLPWMLAVLAEKIRGEVEQRGRKLLEKK